MQLPTYVCMGMRVHVHMHVCVNLGNPIAPRIFAEKTFI